MKKVLQAIVDDPSLEARWLNTLSLLEYTAARKISKTVFLSHPSLDVLKHFADETHNAYIFKHLSQVVSKGRCHEYLCGDEAVSYFQMLDGSISDCLSEVISKDEPHHNYLFITYLVERRAMELYNLYMRTTHHSEVQEEVRRVLLEDTARRSFIEKKVERILTKKGVKNFDYCEAIEESLYLIFVEALRKQIKSERSSKRTSVSSRVSAVVDH